MKLLQILLYLLAGMCLGVVIIVSGAYVSGGVSSLASGRLQFFINYFGMILLFLLVYEIQLIIHESGHLLFGLLTGYSFSSFRIGTTMFLMEDGKLVRKKLQISGTGGQCLMVPPDTEKPPFLLYNLGGVILNFITAGIFFLIFMWLLPYGRWSVFFLFLTIAGVLIGLLNGIPIHTPLLTNDGHNAVVLCRDREAVRSLSVQLLAADAMNHGKRLKDMPAEWFTMPSLVRMRKNDMVTAQAVLRENRLMDEHRFDEAEDTIELLLGKDIRTHGIYRNMLLLDQVFLRLLKDGEQADISPLQTKEMYTFMVQMKDYPSVQRTNFALSLLYHKDREKAEQAYQKLVSLKDTHPALSEVLGELELCEYARKRAENTDIPDHCEE